MDIPISGGGYSSYRSLISVKAKKLLIPYVVVTVFYTVPIKYFTGYFALSDNPLKDIFVGQILNCGDTHLWFLLALFCIFIIVYSMDKVIHDWKINLLIYLICYFVYLNAFAELPQSLIGRILGYLFWFYLGGCFEKIRPDLNKRIKERPKIMYGGCFALLAAITLTTMAVPDSLKIVKEGMLFIRTVTMCFTVYMVSFFIAGTPLIGTRTVKLLRKNTFGLYLYSDTLNYIVLLFAVRLFGHVVFTTNQGAVLLFLSRLVITTVVPLIISTVLRKLKLKYLC